MHRFVLVACSQAFLHYQPSGRSRPASARGRRPGAVQRHENSDDAKDLSIARGGSTLGARTYWHAPKRSVAPR